MQYATASTLYNFGAYGYASSSQSPGSIPVMDWHTVQAMKNKLATEISNFRIKVVGMPGSATRFAILQLVDEARSKIVSAQSFLDRATEIGLWTKQLEDSTLSRINSARESYNAAAGMAATTGGPSAPGVKLATPVKPAPSAPGDGGGGGGGGGQLVTPLRSGIGAGTVLIAAAALWWMSRR